MNATMLDTITAAFVGAIASGATALSAYSLPLLGVFALIALYTQMAVVVASGGTSAGDALASVLLTAVKIGVFYWLLVNLAPMGVAAFQTFLQWGMTPAGNALVTQRFLQPSLVLDVGFKAAFPLKRFVDAFTGPSALWNFFTIETYFLTYWIIIVAFWAVALHLMLTIIEYNLALLVATVLLPWGVLQPTAFFTEFSIGWVTGGLVRILVTGAIVGIAVPLFALVTPSPGGGDPTFYGAMVTMITSGIFALLSWVVPGRAAAIAGRGVSLALHGGTIVAGAAGGMRGALLVTSAIRGVSSMLRR